MSEIKRVKIQSIVESQIPEFLNNDSPIFKEFLEQYYISQEHQTGVVDLAVNLQQYKSIDNFITDNLSLNNVQPIEEQFESAMLMADVNSVNCDAQELDQQLIGKVICIDKTDINNADTCQGDSGGPLYKKIRNDKKSFLIPG
jgi:secreted trypsin-like serine protease